MPNPTLNGSIQKSKEAGPESSKAHGISHSPDNAYLSSSLQRALARDNSNLRVTKASDVEIQAIRVLGVGFKEIDPDIFALSTPVLCGAAKNLHLFVSSVISDAKAASSLERFLLSTREVKS